MNRYLSVWAGSRFLYTGVTQASFQIWGKDDDLRRRLNKQCKGITKMEAQSFKRKLGTLSTPAVKESLHFFKDWRISSSVTCSMFIVKLLKS